MFSGVLESLHVKRGWLSPFDTLLHLRRTNLGAPGKCLQQLRTTLDLWGFGHPPCESKVR